MNRKNKFIPITNGLAFADVFSANMNITRKLVETITGKKISDIRLAKGETTVVNLRNRSIRMDCLIEGEKEYIDLEMQLYNENRIEKRARYYHSAMDVEATRKGTPYEDLKDSIVIFIDMKKDPFKKRKTVYESRTMLTNCGNMIVEDGTYSYYVNFSKDRDKCDNEDVEALADYFQHRKVSSELTEEIDRVLVDLNNEPVWRNDVMTLEEVLIRIRRQDAEEIWQEVARRMFKLGADISFIAAVTKLPIDTIKEVNLTHADADARGNSLEE